MAAAAVAYGAGALLPYAIVLAVMAAAGSLDRFWYWTVTYGSRYGAADTPWEVMKALFALSFGPMFGEYPLIWLLALAGLAVVWLTRYHVAKKLFATLLAVFSCAAVLPGFNFREHYFVLLLPAVGLLTGIALEFIADLLFGRFFRRSRVMAAALPFAIVAVIGVFAIANDRAYYFDAPPDEVSRMMYGSNPFVEAREIGARIAGDTTPADTVGIVGSEPELLVYAGRRSATGYMYVYPLVEPQPDNVRMQHEMMAEIEAARPKYLVYCRVPTSWAANPQSPNDILVWFNRYAPAHYDVVGIVDVGGLGNPPSYFWDADARGRQPAENSVWVLRRKGA